MAFSIHCSLKFENKPVKMKDERMTEAWVIGYAISIDLVELSTSVGNAKTDQFLKDLIFGKAPSQRTLSQCL